MIAFAKASGSFGDTINPVWPSSTDPEYFLHLSPQLVSQMNKLQVLYHFASRLYMVRRQQKLLEEMSYLVVWDKPIVNLKIFLSSY